MTEEEVDRFARLRDPFVPDELGWRVNRAGTRDSGEVWALVVPYIDARAIHSRLDSIFGPERWANSVEVVDNRLITGLGTEVNLGVWVWKYDGVTIDANDDFVDPMKSAASGGFKRTAVLWGIGRYLYEVDEDWAVITGQGRFYQPQSPKGKHPAFRWNPPQLPPWALPQSYRDELASRGTKTAEELKAEITQGLQILVSKEALTTAQIARVKEGLKSGNLGILHRTLDWIRGRNAKEASNG